MSANNLIKTGNMPEHLSDEQRLRRAKRVERKEISRREIQKGNNQRSSFAIKKRINDHAYEYAPGAESYTHNTIKMEPDVYHKTMAESSKLIQGVPRSLYEEIRNRSPIADALAKDFMSRHPECQKSVLRLINESQQHYDQVGRYAKIQARKSLRLERKAIKASRVASFPVETLVWPKQSPGASFKKLVYKRTLEEPVEQVKPLLIETKSVPIKPHFRGSIGADVVKVGDGVEASSPYMKALLKDVGDLAYPKMDGDSSVYEKPPVFDWRRNPVPSRVLMGLGKSEKDPLFNKWHISCLPHLRERVPELARLVEKLLSRSIHVTQPFSRYVSNGDARNGGKNSVLHVSGAFNLLCGLLKRHTHVHAKTWRQLRDHASVFFGKLGHEVLAPSSVADGPPGKVQYQSGMVEAVDDGLHAMLGFISSFAAHKSVAGSLARFIALVVALRSSTSYKGWIATLFLYVAAEPELGKSRRLFSGLLDRFIEVVMRVTTGARVHSMSRPLAVVAQEVSPPPSPMAEMRRPLRPTPSFDSQGDIGVLPGDLEEQSTSTGSHESDRSVEGRRSLLSMLRTRLAPGHKSVYQSANEITPEQDIEIVRTLQRGLFSSEATTFTGTALGRATSELFGSFSILSTMVASGLMGDEAVVSRRLAKFSKLLKFDREGNTVDNVLSRLFRLVEELLKRVTNAYQVRSWSALFQEETRYTDWLDWSETMVNDPSMRFDPGRPAMADLFNKRCAEGRVPPGVVLPLSENDRRLAILSLYDMGEELRSRHAHMSFVCSSIDARRLKLLSAANAIAHGGANNCARITPFGIFVHGPPGIGKTHMCMRAHGSLSRMNALEPSISSCYRFLAKTNFHDTFKSGQHGCMMDDCDTSTAADSANVANHAEQVIQLINSNPLDMEKADVSEKGTLGANFLYLHYTTNFKEGNLERRCMEPQAFWRRFQLSVELVVNPEFKSAAGTLDRAKLALVPDGEANHFIVSTYVGGQEHHAHYKTFVTYHEYIAFVNQKLCAHVAIERKAVQALNEVILTPMCKVCDRAVDHPIPCVAPAGHVPIFQADPGREGLKAGIMTIGVATVGAFVLPYTAAACLVSVLVTSAFFRARPSSSFVWVFAVAGVYWQLFKQEARSRLNEGVYSMSTNVFGVRGINSFMMGWSIFYESCTSLFEALVCGHELSSLSFLGEVDENVVLGLGAVLLAFVGARKAYQAWCTRQLQMAVGTIEDVMAVPPTSTSWYRVPISSYTRPHQMQKAPTWSEEELIQNLQHRMLRLRFGTRSLWGIRVEGNLVLTMKHILFSDASEARKERNFPEQYVETMSNGTPVKLKLHAQNTHLFRDRDLILFDFTGLLPLKTRFDLVAKLPRVSLTGSGIPVDSEKLIKPDGYDTSSVRAMPVGYYESTGLPSWSAKFETVQGDCGRPLVVRQGNNFAFVGMHGIGYTSFTQWGSLAEDVNYSEYEDARARLMETDYFFQPYDTVVDLTQLRRGAGEVMVKELQAKSSLYVSLTEEPFPCHVIGTVVGNTPGGGSMKSSVHETAFWVQSTPQEKEEVLDLFGEKSFPFQVPSFKGHMVPGKNGLRYVDPHTVSLESSRNVCGDSRLWELSVKDYLKGCEDLPGVAQIKPLSLYAAFVGIEGTSIGGTNMSTSAGPPFFTNKHVIVKIDHDAKELEFSDEFMNELRKRQCVLLDGDVFSPMCLHTLKDEIVSPEKNAARKIRVFNVLPFADNLLMKQMFGPLVAVMRDNMYFFETAVGMNIASMELMGLVQYLTMYPDMMAADKKSFDTRASALENIAVAVFFRELAAVCHYTVEEQSLVYRLALGACMPTRIIKGDLFITPHMMPTGFWLTIWYNCVRSSLQARYAYFRASPSVNPPAFRDVVKLMNLGDDTISCVSPRVPWYNNLSLQACLAEVGAEVTSSLKSANLQRYDTLETVSFLKRRFLKLPCGLWVCPIEKKTILKMLCIGRRSKFVTEYQNLCTSLSSVLAESWMHGECFYNSVFSVVNRLKVTHRLLDKDLALRSYTEQRYLFVNNKLRVWDPLDTSSVVNGPGSIVKASVAAAPEQPTIQ